MDSQQRGEQVAYTISGVTTDRHASNTKFQEIAKLLGLETSYFSGMYRVRINGQFAGQMTAEAWLDHLRICMVASKRC